MFNCYKKKHKDALQAVTIYRLIETYVNDYYELNHVDEDLAPNTNNNTVGDDILILDSTCNTIDPETLVKITKEEHSKILAIFKKHKVNTSEDLNKIAKRKRPLRALQKEFFAQKVKKLDYWTQERLCDLLDFYNDKIWDQRLLFPEFFATYYKKEIKRANSTEK